MVTTLGVRSPFPLAGDVTHVIVVSLLVSILLVDTAQTRRARLNGSECPDGCFCNQVSKVVYCSRRGLTAIPRSIPDQSLQLNLNGNIFDSTLIKRSNLSALISLEHLYLSECGIERIEVSAFEDLTNLQWLDLSNNLLARIEDHTFRGLSLMHLFLNGNRNLRFGAGSFADMQTTGLYLHECSISRLSFDVFAPLNGTLQKLWLDSNELKTIDKTFIPLFSSLTHLRLGQNPLHCTCESSWIKKLYDSHSEIFEGAGVPSCLSPARLRGKPFDEIPSFEFSCEAPVFRNIDAVLEDNRGVLTCRATGDPAPTLYWVAPMGISTKYKPKKDYNKYNEAVMDISDQIRAGRDFSGQYFCLAINEAGNMTFTFNVSWPSFALPVTQSIPPSTAASKSTTKFSTPYIAIDKINWIDEESDSSDLEISDLYQISEPPDRGNPQNKVEDDSSNNNALHKSNRTVKQEHMHTQGRYSLVELIGAIVGTFVCTVLLCLLVIPIFLKRKWHKKRHSSIEKPPLKDEPVYMAPVNQCNHYSGKLAQPYRHYSQEYYFDNSSPMISR